MKFKDAISQALIDEMTRNKSIYITGIAVDYPSGIFGSTSEVYKKFGSKRVFDAPAMENALTGIAIGAATQGLRPVLVHPRVDFMFLSFDMLIQLAAKWKYMFGNNAGSVPIVIRAIIGKGWGQGSTHSQSIQSVLGHFPGLNVIMPTFPSDVYGMLINALRIDTPTLILEHRSLYETEGDVKFDNLIEFGKAKILKRGSDITIVSSSFMTIEAFEAVKQLKKDNISVELVDLRSIRPLDKNTLIKSIKKTGRLIVVDNSWDLYGVASQIASIASEYCVHDLKCNVQKITLPNCPAPVSETLEKAFYPNSETIYKACHAIMGKKIKNKYYSKIIDDFKGPY
jgi:pyruvate/2-oxoglutarate/acetoin dehydrogenase E1 component